LFDFSLGWIRGSVYKFLYTRIQGSRLKPGALSVFLMLLTPFTKTLRRSIAPSDGFGDKKTSQAVSFQYKKRDSTQRQQIILGSISWLELLNSQDTSYHNIGLPHNLIITMRAWSHKY